MSGIRVISVAPIPVEADRLAPATPLMVIEARIYTEHGGNLDVALQLARTAKQILPDQPEVNDTLGWVYLKKNLSALAIPVLQESVKRDPRNAVYLYHLGLGYARSGEDAKAREALQQALQAQPDFADAADARRLLMELEG